MSANTVKISVAAKHALVTRWIECLQAERQLDYNLGALSRDIFEAVGRDQAAHDRWCSDYLPGCTRGHLARLLDCRLAVEMVPSFDKWRDLGGLNQIRALARVAPKDRPKILALVESTNKRIQTIIRERERAANPTPTAAPAPTTSRPSTVNALGPLKDCKVLSEYIRKTCKVIPMEIRDILDIYAPAPVVAAPRAQSKKRAA